ncbi:Fic family protein [Parafrankia sp. FMc2]|uniref:Fic family protein n=1 Tax=Parafrankia sp. FMc2 TaxID=3233196 RepID=UPI0034D4D530
MAGTERRVSRVWNDGAAYDMVVPEPVAGLAGVPAMTAVAERMRALDALAARPGTGTQVRALLAVECLSSRQVTRMSAAGSAGSRPVGDGQLRRFTRACAAGVAAEQLGPAELRRAHRAVVPGGGTVRSGTVWVGGVPTPPRAEFVPPPPEDLGRLLADLGAFLMRDDLCPVAQVAIGYAQLVVIHPFRDGNGRVGRWLLQVMPRRRGLVHELVAPMGLYFLANAPAYMAAHAAFRAGDLERWCSFFGDAVIRCSAATE